MKQANDNEKGLKVNAGRSDDAVRLEDAEKQLTADLSACAAPDNVNMDNVKCCGVVVNMVRYFEVNAVGFVVVNAVRSSDADRLEDAEKQLTADLSACVSPDNVDIDDVKCCGMVVNVVRYFGVNGIRFWQLTLSGLSTLTGWRTLRSN